jgi:hypothetical protein
LNQLSGCVGNDDKKAKLTKRYAVLAEKRAGFWEQPEQPQHKYRTGDDYTCVFIEIEGSVHAAAKSRYT